MVARQDFRSKLFLAKVPSNFMLLNGDIRLILTNCEMCLTFRVTLLTLLLALQTNSKIVKYMPMGHDKDEIQCANHKVTCYCYGCRVGNVMLIIFASNKRVLGCEFTQPLE